MKTLYFNGFPLKFKFVSSFLSEKITSVVLYYLTDSVQREQQSPLITLHQRTIQLVLYSLFNILFICLVINIFFMVFKV